ncbi:MAG TPA: PQQ-binding-like beta-propeller repeat protein [Anaerolineae bacterium]|nr:PQQ-binding-like beta-propeller repeat protein [Anaerolineae bacterium]
MLLTSCGPPSAAPVVTPSDTTHPPTLLPTAAISLTPSPTSIPPYPVLSGTPVPPIGGSIEVGNLDEITQLAVFSKGPAMQVLYAPDGSRLAVISPMGIYFYDPETLALKSFEPTSMQIRCAAFAPDGLSIVLGMENGTVQVVPMEGGGSGRIFEPAWDDFPYPTQSVAISNQGLLLAAGFRGGGIHTWDVNSGELLWSRESDHGDIQSMSFSPDDETLVVGSESGEVALYAVDDGAVLWSKEHDYAVSRVAFSPDGNTVASCGGDARAWDAQTGELRYTIEDCYDDLAFSPDGSVLLVGSPEWPARVYLNFAYPSTGEIYREIEQLGDSLINAAFSPDGCSLATVVNTASSWHETTIVIWDLASITQRVWTAHGAAAHSIAFSPDGELMAVGFAEGSVWLWRLRDGSIVHAFPPPTTEDDCGTWGAIGEHLVSVDFAPDGSQVYSLHANACVRSWSVSNGSLLHTMRGESGIMGPALSPNQEYVAAGGVVLIPDTPFITALWQVETGGTPIRMFNSQQVSPLLAFSSDGEQVAAFFSEDYNTSTIRIYDVSSARQLVEIDALEWLTGMRFMPGDTALASLDQHGTVRLWQTTDGTLISTLGGTPTEVEPVPTSAFSSPPGPGQIPLPQGMEQQFSLEQAAALAFSSMGDILAGSGYPDGLSLWSVPDGAFLKRLEPLAVEFPLHDHWVGGDISPIYSVAFSPDGRVLALGGLDGEVWLWGIPQR